MNSCTTTLKAWTAAALALLLLAPVSAQEPPRSIEGPRPDPNTVSGWLQAQRDKLILLLREVHGTEQEGRLEEALYQYDQMMAVAAASRKHLDRAVAQKAPLSPAALQLYLAIHRIATDGFVAKARLFSKLKRPKEALFTLEQVVTVFRRAEIRFEELHKGMTARQEELNRLPILEIKEDSIRFQWTLENGLARNLKARPLLIKMLRADTSSIVRRGAARALGHFGRRAGPAVSTMIQELTSDKPYVAYMCDHGLREIAKSYDLNGLPEELKATASPEERMATRRAWANWWTRVSKRPAKD